MAIQVKLFLPALISALIICTASQCNAASSADDEKAGAILFRDKGCAFCHGADGVGTAKAPSLVDLRKNKLWPPENITRQITNGGQKMPPFGDALTDKEIAQLVAYLRAKNRPVPPPLPAPAPLPTPAPQ